MQNMNKSHSSLDGESGRSMVEMLGVLAIIGVLSVGGIAGYTMAMNKHKANELLNEASKRAVVVSGHLLSGKEGSIAEFTDPSGYQFGYATVDGENKFKLTLKTSAGVKIDESICAQIKNVVGGEHINPSVNDNCTEFTYNNDLGSGAGAGTTSKPCTCTGETYPCVETAPGVCESKYYAGISGKTHYELKELIAQGKISTICPNGGTWASFADLPEACNAPGESCDGSWNSSAYGFIQECTPDGETVDEKCLDGSFAAFVVGNSGYVSGGAYARGDDYAALCVR